MKNALKTSMRPRLTLAADTAEDLMTPNPVSIGADALVSEAVAALIDKGVSAVPVIDEAGHPMGVLSRTDLLVHDREKFEYVPEEKEAGREAEREERIRGKKLQVVNVDRTRVRDLMTPTIFAVPASAPARRVVDEIVSLKVHRLFVVDGQGVLVGVISAFDVLRHLGEVEEE